MLQNPNLNPSTVSSNNQRSSNSKTSKNSVQYPHTQIPRPSYDFSKVFYYYKKSRLVDILIHCTKVDWNLQNLASNIVKKNIVFKQCSVTGNTLTVAIDRVHSSNFDKTPLYENSVIFVQKGTLFTPSNSNINEFFFCAKDTEFAVDHTAKIVVYACTPDYRSEQSVVLNPFLIVYEFHSQFDIFSILTKMYAKKEYQYRNKSNTRDINNYDEADMHDGNDENGLDEYVDITNRANMVVEYTDITEYCNPKCIQEIDYKENAIWLWTNIKSVGGWVYNMGTSASRTFKKSPTRKGNNNKGNELGNKSLENNENVNRNEHHSKDQGHDYDADHDYGYLNRVDRVHLSDSKEKENQYKEYEKELDKYVYYSNEIDNKAVNNNNNKTNKTGLQKDSLQLEEIKKMLSKRKEGETNRNSYRNTNDKVELDENHNDLNEIKETNKQNNLENNEYDTDQVRGKGAIEKIENRDVEQTPTNSPYSTKGIKIDKKYNESLIDKVNNNNGFNSMNMNGDNSHQSNPSDHIQNTTDSYSATNKSTTNKPLIPKLNL